SHPAKAHRRGLVPAHDHAGRAIAIASTRADPRRQRLDVEGALHLHLVALREDQLPALDDELHRAGAGPVLGQVSVRADPLLLATERASDVHVAAGLGTDRAEQRRELREALALGDQGLAALA